MHINTNLRQAAVNRRDRRNGAPAIRYVRALRAAALLVGLLLAGGSCAQQSTGPMKVDLEQAIQLALAHNHALKAARTLIQQSEAEETTAAIRPNPVFTYDDLFIPIFSPSQFSSANLDNITEFDVGLSWTFERGGKRQARIRAAKDQTAVTRSTVTDNERTLAFNVGQQFVIVLQAKSTVDFAKRDLDSFQKTVSLSQDRLTGGALSQGDFLKIRLQLLQFQTDVYSAQVALVQALASLRELLGYEAVPSDYDVAGELSYVPLHANKEDLQARALNLRPDLAAAKQGVAAADSQYDLAKANGKRALTTTWTYSHVSDANNLGFTANIEIPIFDRNQGEIARTHFAIAQAQETQTAAQQMVMTDVANSYETFHTADKVVQLYQSGYLKNADDSREISEFAFQHGAASLLDLLDAERSYRATQLAYLQALGAYMVAVEQLKETVGTRKLP